jgi:hypothetical protein
MLSAIMASHFQDFSPFMAMVHEIKIRIMEHCDLPTLVNLVLTSRGMYGVYKGSEGVVTYHLTENTIGHDIFPLAVARYVAANVVWRFPNLRLGKFPMYMTCDQLADQIRRFGNAYLVDQARKCTFPKIACSFAMAKAIIEHKNYVDIWLIPLLSKFIDDLPEQNNVLTAAEIRRMERALYIRDILAELLHDEWPNWSQQRAFTDIQQAHPHLNEILWSYFTPWEYLQIQVVQREILLRIDNGTWS